VTREKKARETPLSDKKKLGIRIAQGKKPGRRLNSERGGNCSNGASGEKQDGT